LPKLVRKWRRSGSPGEGFLYAGDGADGKHRLDRDETMPLSGTEGVYGPFFSPDGQFIGFFAG
jgi:hypothetical protein